MAPEPVLEHRGRDVLAAGGDDELLLPPGDGQESLVVEFADIAGAEPAVLGEGLLGSRLVLPVAREDGRPADQNLAVVTDLDRGTGQRLPDGADLVAVRPVDRRRRGGLGEAIPLKDDDADAAEEVAEPIAERRAAGDGVSHPAAERRPQL